MGPEDVPLAEGEAAGDLPRVALGGGAATAADGGGGEAGAISRRLQISSEADAVPELLRVSQPPPADRQRGDRGGVQDGVHATAETVGNDLVAGRGPADRGLARAPSERGLGGGVSDILASKDPSRRGDSRGVRQEKVAKGRVIVGMGAIAPFAITLFRLVREMRIAVQFDG